MGIIHGIYGQVEGHIDLRVSEELAPKSIRDEIIWSLYDSLD